MGPHAALSKRWGRTLKEPHFPSIGVNFKEDAQKCDARELAVTNVNQTWPQVSPCNPQLWWLFFLLLKDKNHNKNGISTVDLVCKCFELMTVW